ASGHRCVCDESVFGREHARIHRTHRRRDWRDGASRIRSRESSATAECAAIKTRERTGRASLLRCGRKSADLLGEHTFIADALRYAGAQSVVHAKQDWPQIGLEEVVHLNPDYLVFA